MKSFRILAVVGLLAMAGGLVQMRADSWDKTTTVTVNEPIQVPGTVLAAGTYTFRLADLSSDRHVVQIFNQNSNKLITTVMAIPNYQLEPAGRTILIFAERPTGEPEALEAWFYPGDNFGQEFVYPRAEAAKLSQLNGTNVPALNDNETPAAAAPVANSTPVATEEPVTTPNTAATAPAPVVQEPQSSTAPALSNTPTQPAMPEKELPKTASDLPLIGMAGFLALSGALMLRGTRRQS